MNQPTETQPSDEDFARQEARIAEYQAQRDRKNKEMQQIEDDCTDAAAELAALLAAGIIPHGMAVTPPEIYRAHIFKTEICERLKNFSFEPRFWEDGIFAKAAPKTREYRQRKTCEIVMGYLRNKGAIVVLTGKRGLGKTTIAAQIAINRLWEDWESRISGGPVLHRITSYRKLTGIVGKLKALYGDFGSIGIETLESIRDHLASVELLIIDELNEGAEDSRHKDRILTDILDRRYAGRRDTLLITNQTKDEFNATANASIKSRMNEHGGIVACEWESFRDYSHQDHPII